MPPKNANKTKQATPETAAATASAPAPAPAPTPVPEPAVEPAPKKKRAPKAAAAAAAAATTPVEPVAAPEPMAVDDDDMSSLGTVSTGGLGSVITRGMDVDDALAQLEKDMSADLRTIQASCSRLNKNFTAYKRKSDLKIKATSRLVGKQKRIKRRSPPELDENGVPKPRAMSGFSKPLLVSDEIMEFLGKPIGTPVLRAEIATAIAVYAKANGLISPENKRKFFPDAKMRALLRMPESVDVESLYFGVQRYLTQHIKAPVPASAPAPTP